MPDNLSIDTDQMGAAAARLEHIATNLERTVSAHQTSLTTAPAGADEVSVAAAKSFDETAERFVAEVGRGVSAIRDVASALREQSGAIDAHDSAVAGDMFVS